MHGENNKYPKGTVAYVRCDAEFKASGALTEEEKCQCIGEADDETWKDPYDPSDPNVYQGCGKVRNGQPLEPEGFSFQTKCDRQATSRGSPRR